MQHCVCATYQSLVIHTHTHICLCSSSKVCLCNCGFCRLASDGDDDDQSCSSSWPAEAANRSPTISTVVGIVQQFNNFFDYQQRQPLNKNWPKAVESCWRAATKKPKEEKSAVNLGQIVAVTVCNSPNRHTYFEDTHYYNYLLRFDLLSSLHKLSLTLSSPADTGARRHYSLPL